MNKVSDNIKKNLYYIGFLKLVFIPIFGNKRY